MIRQVTKYLHEEDIIDREFTVNVTREDIDNGIPQHATCCPIALAVCRTLNIYSEDAYIEVDMSGIEFQCVDVVAEIRKPTKIRFSEFVRLFDAGEWVPEFEFTIVIYEKEYDYDGGE